MTYQNLYFNRARRIARLLRIIPYTCAVFLTGSVARGEAGKSSDIDFFIVVKSGRIWTCRVLVTMIIQIIGKRRYGNNVAGRICLNRYQTEDNLEITPHNAYHRKDYSQVVPLWDQNNIYDKYKKANKWIGKLKVHKVYKVHKVRNQSSCIQRFLESILDTKFGDFFEKKQKKYQKKRITSDPRTKASKQWQIVATDNELSFHPEKKG